MENYDNLFESSFRTKNRLMRDDVKIEDSKYFPSDEQLNHLYSITHSPSKNINSKKRQDFINFAKLALREYGNYKNYVK